jgi:hypothetical protein
MAIELEFNLPHPITDVWQIIGDPGRIDWVAGVASCEYDGTVRRFKMDGAGELAEQIFELTARHTLLFMVSSNPHRLWPAIAPA